MNSENILYVIVRVKDFLHNTLSMDMAGLFEGMSVSNSKTNVFGVDASGHRTVA